MEDYNNPFDDISSYIDSMYYLTQEVTASGELFIRAVARDFPMEIIFTLHDSKDERIFRLNLN